MFVERLDAIMKERGVTRSKLLTDLKMGKNQFKVWEGGSKPTAATVSAIAAYFNVSPDYLTGNDTLMGQTDLTPKANDTDTTEQEKALLNMFRSTSEEGRLRIIQAVMNITDSDRSDIHRVYRAARSTDNAEHRIEILSESAINKLRSATPVTSEEDL